MIRFAYTAYYALPAPFVYVTIHCPQSGTISGEVPAQLDSAADCTVLPGKLVDDLQLVSIGQITVGGFGGQLHQLDAFYVNVAIRSLPAISVRALRNDEEPFVLLGRDVLNHFRALLDGPALAAEIS